MYKKCSCGHRIESEAELKRNQFIGIISDGSYNLYMFNCRICDSTFTLLSDDIGTERAIELDAAARKISDSIIV